MRVDAAHACHVVSGSMQCMDTYSKEPHGPKREIKDNTWQLPLGDS